jgi:hypothetical protein
MQTPNLKVEYRLEASVCHESFAGERTEVPSVFFPVIITRDSKGAVVASKNEYLSTSLVSSFGDPIQTIPQPLYAPPGIDQTGLGMQDLTPGAPV